MEKAFTCEQQKEKIGKYQFRIKKILRDAVHHQSKARVWLAWNDVLVMPNPENQGKCKPKKRNRRDDFDDLEAEYAEIVAEMENDFTGKTTGKTKPSGKGHFNPNCSAKLPFSVVDKLERVCSKMMAAVWDSSNVQHCRKRGAWELRSRGLMQSLGAMKKACRKSSNK